MKPNNPPAFPHTFHMEGFDRVVCEGMTLRDWFAGQAMAGLLANSSDGVLRAMGKEAVERGEARLSETVARLAHECADAMLSQRAKSED